MTEKYEPTTVNLARAHFEMLADLRVTIGKIEDRRHISYSEIVRRAIELLHKETA